MEAEQAAEWLARDVANALATVDDSYYRESATDDLCIRFPTVDWKRLVAEARERSGD